MSTPLDAQFEKIIKEYKDRLLPALNEALVAASEHLIPHLIAASPYDPAGKSPHFRDCWIIEKKYNNVKYIGNSKTVSRAKKARDAGIKGEIPLANILEFSQSKPFIRKTFAKQETALFNVFTRELAKKTKEG